jgi:hypothetical protein
MNNIICKVFKIDYTWSCFIFYIPDEISFNDINTDPEIKKLTKRNYIGKYSIPIDILKHYHKKNNYYYIINLND